MKHKEVTAWIFANRFARKLRSGLPKPAVIVHCSRRRWKRPPANDTSRAPSFSIKPAVSGNDFLRAPGYVDRSDLQTFTTSVNYRRTAGQPVIDIFLRRPERLLFPGGMQGSLYRDKAENTKDTGTNAQRLQREAGRAHASRTASLAINSGEGVPIANLHSLVQRFPTPICRRSR